MKYCLSMRQPTMILKEADEIKCDYKDIDGIFNIIEELADKKFIIRIPSGVIDIDWDKIVGFSAKAKIVIALAAMLPENIQQCKDHNLDFYWAYPITTYEELNALSTLGVCEAYIGGPLYFDLKQVAKIGLPIRLVANVCFDNYIPRHDGIRGTYIRPEDVDAYGKYVDTIEFIADNTTKEATLFKVYSKDKSWPGNLKLLLTNFNVNIDNRIVPAEFAEARMQCRQNCMRTGSCHFCTSVMNYLKTLDKIKDEWIPGVGFKQE